MRDERVPSCCDDRRAVCRAHTTGGEQADGKANASTRGATARTSARATTGHRNSFYGVVLPKKHVDLVRHEATL